MVQIENFKREISTLNEALKQLDLVKKEFIEKLTEELENVKQSSQREENLMGMVSEDLRSQAFELSKILSKTKFQLAWAQ